MKLFRSRYLLSIAAPPLEDGALLVAGDRILAVGPYRELAAAHPRAAAVVFEDAVVMPPLVNAHTHLELTDFPEWAAAAGTAGEGGDFADWILHLVRVRRTTSEEAVAASLRHGLQQSLQAGTGAVGDILTTLPAASAYAATPLRGRVFAEVLGVDPRRVESRLEQVAMHLAASPAAALRWGLSPHAPYTLTASTLAAASDFASVHELSIAMHWAETVEEREFSSLVRGPLAEKLYPMAGWPLPATTSLCDLAGLPAGSLLIHGVHPGQDDIDAVAAAGHGVVLCPRSNCRFGAARAPLAAYRRAGVPLALGTDSRASCPSLSIWDELAFARNWFTGELAPADWLAIATYGGAAALGLSQRMGQLTAGCEASFQVVALPAGATAVTVEEALVSAGEETAVQALYLAGKEFFRSTTQPMSHSTN